MNPIERFLIAAACSLLLPAGAVSARTGRIPDEAACLLPVAVEGVAKPVLSLDGTWQFRYAPKGRWEPVAVPGELAMQGYAIEHDRPYTYRRTFTVPADFAGRRVILRFDGVYSHARLAVNGSFVREHHGGFTRWETDVTELVRPGRRNELMLEVTDRLDDISYASGYAHHPVGGILRSVTLFALPESSIYDFRAETLLDADYRDALLKIGFEALSVSDAEVVYTLTDPSGAPCPLAESRFALREGANSHELPVRQPLKWDAEHPNLYTLSVRILRGGRPVCGFERSIGFRDVRVDGDRLLVNGRPVKLRGACRHDIHPTLGRTTTAELDSLDAVLFKRANMNFVRTSHYPPTERFLNYCDRYGIYVESETSVCFVDTWRQKNYAPGNTQDSAEFAPRYLGACREMVKAFRTHPSVVLWSIGNESVYGRNFQQCRDWVKATDTTRPVIFSYPGTEGDRAPIYDILSMHYQDVNGNLDSWGRSVRGFQAPGIPALFDEWAHPACYTYATLREDPNIREFWGHSIEKMWSGLFEARGGLGGAIWGYVDEIFMLPEPKAGTAYWREFAHTAKPEGYRGRCVGYGEWGIVDVWRREKPEFWATKKAYSPVRLLTSRVTSFHPGQRLLLPLYNRFDHTDLAEIEVRYAYRGVERRLAGPRVAPHGKGLLVIPADEWAPGEELTIGFYTASGELIDRETLRLGDDRTTTCPTAPAACGALRIEETADRITVCGEGFEIPFSRASGLICGAASPDGTLIEEGPFLHLDINLNHLTGAEVRSQARQFLTSPGDWRKRSFACTLRGDAVEVTLAGSYGDVAVDYAIRILPDGVMNISYTVDGQPNGYLRETGLAFRLPGRIDSLSWERRGMWSCYPDDALAGNRGRAALYGSRPMRYGEHPARSWADDTHEYYYWSDAGAGCTQPLTRRAKGMKENILRYGLSAGGGEVLTVYSADASLACRLSKPSDAELVLHVDSGWDYPEIAWGNYCLTLEAVPCCGEVTIRLGRQ